MSVIQYERHKCDNCGKEVEQKHNGRPVGWLEVSVTRWYSSRGETVLDKEVCSSKCALEILKKLKKIPTPKPKKMIMHF